MNASNSSNVAGCPSPETSNNVLFAIVGVAIMIYTNALSSGGGEASNYLDRNGIVVLIALSFMQQRSRFMLNRCWGLPGIAVPVNLLVMIPHRFVYAAIFGAMAGDLIFYYQTVSTGGFLGKYDDPYLNGFLTGVLTPVVITLLLSCKYFPMIACVNPPLIPIVGRIIGFCFTCLIVALNIYLDYVTVYCGNSSAVIACRVLGNLPQYVFYIYLLIWYSYQVIDNLIIIHRKKWSCESIMRSRDVEAHYYTKYVKKLLRRRRQKVTWTMRVLKFFFPYIISPLKLPLKFIAAIVVMSVFLFKVTFWIAAEFILQGSALIKMVEDDRIMNFFIKSGDSQLDAYKVVLLATRSIGVILPLGPICAILLCFLLMFNLCSSVHNHIAMVLRGDLSFTFIKSFKPTISHVSSSWSYTGYQVAYLFAAFVLYTWIAWVVMFAIALVVFVLRLSSIYNFDTESFILSFVEYSTCPALWLLIVLTVQLLLIKLFFLQRKAGKFAVITNQRLFNWLAYILLLYNCFVGLLNAVARIALSFVISVLLIIRLDRVVLMRGFEFLDFGHKAYLGFLYMELAYNHPVVHVFVKTVMESIQKRKVQRRKEAHSDDIAVVEANQFAPAAKLLMEVSSEKNRSARTRWLVAYTLIRNPQLIAQRKANGKTEEEAEQENNVPNYGFEEQENGVSNYGF